MDVGTLVSDLFRRESARLVAALVRLLGPAHVALAEDVVHDALVTAMQAWRFGAPDDPKAWILQVAKRRAIDVLRRERKQEPLGELDAAVELMMSAAADAENQLAMMFSVCDPALKPETHVSLILRLLCGFSAAEIASAFLVDVPTIDRRLHRGRARLRELGALAIDDVPARQPSVEAALYLMFNEGNPLAQALCADALRLAELLLDAIDIEPRTVHALAALFCFTAARLPARVDDGVLVPLAEQDRTRWDHALIGRGIRHLGESASGPGWTRWHLEAGIAFEHARAPSLVDTRWETIVEYYDALVALAPGPIVLLNRGLAIAELRGVATGRAELAALAAEPKLATYSYYWAGRADLERRDGNVAEARAFYERAISHASSDAERRAYARYVT
ncbi:MAG: sigma-70 family RNA polymerase sigma factor [Kofleriaceae bacterium]